MDDRIFELRIYRAAPGRMKALLARFRDHTFTLFQKHNMKLVGFWLPSDEKEAEERLYYILAFPSKEAGEKCWEAFRTDPDWIQAKTESEADGKLVEKIESTWLKSMVD